MSSRKFHLCDSTEPLKEGSKLLSLCGIIVPDAVFVVMWDEKELQDVAPGLSGSCRHCFAAYTGGDERRYVYGIRPGEEARQEIGD
jgi:hypothetical protein